MGEKRRKRMGRTQMLGARSTLRLAQMYARAEGATLAAQTVQETAKQMQGMYKEAFVAALDALGLDSSLAWNLNFQTGVFTLPEGADGGRGEVPERDGLRDESGELQGAEDQ